MISPRFAIRRVGATLAVAQFQEEAVMEYRKECRLSGYDYSSAGGYYITICTHERKAVLSRVMQHADRELPVLELTDLGEVVDSALLDMNVYKGFRADAWIIMPDHIHLIVMADGATDAVLGNYVGAIKSVVTKRWRDRCDLQGSKAGKIWQRNYYDHILRNEADYLEKLDYMKNNPIRWCEKYMR